MDSESLKKLKEAHEKRLHVLQLQEAQFGLNCPPNIILEIEDTKSKIDNIENQMRSSQETYKRRSHRKMEIHDLEQFVTFYLKHQIENRLSFTAYDITLALRRKLPRTYISSNDIRELVHWEMQLLIEFGFYKREVVEFDTSLARQYIPIEIPFVI